jgi:hypothetical protein
MVALAGQKKWADSGKGPMRAPYGSRTCLLHASYLALDIGGKTIQDKTPSQRICLRTTRLLRQASDAAIRFPTFITKSLRL